jgi:hypothetical protein
MKIAILLFALIAAWSHGGQAWARGGSMVMPPAEIVGKIQAVEPAENRLVMEARNLEVWATDRRQLEGLAPGQTVRLRYQQQDGRPVIISIVPVPK